MLFFLCLVIKDPACLKKHTQTISKHIIQSKTKTKTVIDNENEIGNTTSLLKATYSYIHTLNKFLQ